MCVCACARVCMLDDIEQTAYQLLSKLALREPHSVREVSDCKWHACVCVCV
jgi:hypothetical protein